jgi:cytidylate kinase
MLARRLRLPYLDTGAMYRAVGLKAKQEGILLPITDTARVAALAARCKIDLATEPEGFAVRLDGQDVSQEIRLPEVSLYASAVSSIPEVRRLMVARQRELGARSGGVLEGRDIGTRVFPETPFKFFLTASEGERARRRCEELARRGTPQPLEAVLEEMRKRDRDDSTRPDSPLTCDESYVRIETDGLTPEEIVEAISRRISGAPGPGP